MKFELLTLLLEAPALRFKCHPKFGGLSSEDKKQILGLTVAGRGGQREAIKSGEANRDRICVARNADGIILGWSSFNRDPEEDQKTAVINVFISSELRGQGIGKKLFLMIFKEAQKSGFKRVSAFPTAKPGSRTFFERMKALVKGKVKEFTIH